VTSARPRVSSWSIRTERVGGRWGRLGGLEGLPASKAYSRGWGEGGRNQETFSLSPLCDKALRGRTATLRLWDGIRGYTYGVYSTTGIASTGEGLCVLDGKGFGEERELNSNLRFVLNEYPDTRRSFSCYRMLIFSRCNAPLHLTHRQNKQFLVTKEVST